MSPNDIGVIKPIPVQRWLDAKSKWDTKFAKEKRKVQKQRVEEMAKGYRDFAEGDVPPPSALAGRRGVIKGEEGEEKKKKSWGMSMWGRWGSKHDEKTMEREKEMDREVKITNVEADGAVRKEERAQDGEATPKRPMSRSRSRPKARRRQVSNLNQRAQDENISPDKDASPEGEQKEALSPLPISSITSSFSPNPSHSTYTQQPPTNNTTNNDHNNNLASATTTTTIHTSSNRPYENGVAYPFKLNTEDARHVGANSSTVTLHGEGEQAVAAAAAAAAVKR